MQRTASSLNCSVCQPGVRCCWTCYLQKKKTCFVISWLVITKADAIKILRTLEFSKVQKVSTSTKVLEKQTWAHPELSWEEFHGKLPCRTAELASSSAGSFSRTLFYKHRDSSSPLMVKGGEWSKRPFGLTVSSWVCSKPNQNVTDMEKWMFPGWAEVQLEKQKLTSKLARDVKNHK